MEAALEHEGINKSQKLIVGIMLHTLFEIPQLFHPLGAILPFNFFIY
jgi:hypothetical protein